MKKLKQGIKTVVRPLLPTVRSVTRSLTGTPAVGYVDFGDLRRTRPISRNFGTDRGLPIDRYYVEAFLSQYAQDVRGRVLEIGEDTYTRRFGGEWVMQADILHVTDENPRATIVADLADAPQIPDAQFDAVILTQTLHLIFEPLAALRTLERILKPGGVLLLTVPGITPTAAGTRWGSTWHWSFTEISLRRMLCMVFGEEACTFSAHGNVLVATAFLQGLAAAELEAHEFAAFDPSYPVILTARVRKTR